MAIIFLFIILEVNAIDLTRVEADEQLTSHSNAPSRHVVDHASASVHTSAASEQSSSAPSEGAYACGQQSDALIMYTQFPCYLKKLRSS